MGSVGEQLPAPSTRRRILFIDAYDSFSNNITSLLSTLLDVDVFILPIDTPISKETFRRELRHYEAVVCGPGPGSPENEADVGLMRWLWELEHDDLLPVLGVCLGFQSLVLACGGQVRRLRRGLHGMVRTIEHRSKNTTTRDEGDLFQGVGKFKATLYHSLCADIGQDLINDWEDEKWDCPLGKPDIVPLAWVEEHRNDSQGTERILMALKHRRKPFWGLQYHPESVCTEEAGNEVVRNWYSQALRWNLDYRRVTSSDCGEITARNAVRTSLLQPIDGPSSSRRSGRTAWDTLLRHSTPQLFERKTIPLTAGVEVPDIAEVLNSTGTDHVILDSANGDQPPPQTGVDVRGRFSIIAVDVDKCLRIEFHTGDEFVTVVNSPTCGLRSQVPLPAGQTVWHLLAELHELKRAGFEKAPCQVLKEDELPFLGGFVGFVTYEQGLSDINIQLPRVRGHTRPDICLAWVTKSVVVDHQTGVLHVQDLEGQNPWVESTVKKLQSSEMWCHNHQHSLNCSSSRRPGAEIVVQKPEHAKYEAKVRMCQEYIAAGESYELCLTDQTNITRAVKAQPNSTDSAPQPASPEADSVATDSSWNLYRTLRRRNPAPFASYIRLGGATLVSSSPERFLQYDPSGLCSMKPMKGTVKKSSEPGDGYAKTLAEAEAILHIPKEEAENLMIVDLVRHDLHGICGAGRVMVPELLKVEEYQTVYTMITWVQGQLPPVEECGKRYSGLDVLSASLPPGSMTGAPKKRSCEILQQIEDGKERSLYSGVVGYMCVTGRGDWSVTIRSMFRWDDESEADTDKEVWHIGAGGAVTILSTPEGEREEMFLKLARPLSIFNDDL